MVEKESAEPTKALEQLRRENSGLWEDAFKRHIHDIGIEAGATEDYTLCLCVSARRLQKKRSCLMSHEVADTDDR